MARNISVEGMSCEGCERTVRDAILDVDGVEGVDVDRETESATVEGDADPDDVVRAVNDAGYDARA